MSYSAGTLLRKPLTSPAIGFDGIGWSFWLWVTSGNVVAIVFVFLLVPESKSHLSTLDERMILTRLAAGNKTLEQVDYLVRTNDPYRGPREIVLMTRAVCSKGLRGSAKKLRCHGRGYRGWVGHQGKGRCRAAGEYVTGYCSVNVPRIQI